MNELLTTLLKLQSYDFNETTETLSDAALEELRAKVPLPILGHYDRLVARGKKGVAIVRNQVCTGCHMRVPIGTINTLMQGTDIQLCGSCGRYLYLPDEAENKFIDTVVAGKPAAKVPKPRKRKTALEHAV